MEEIKPRDLQTLQSKKPFFSVIGILIIVLVIAAAGFVWYLIYQPIKIPPPVQPSPRNQVQETTNPPTENLAITPSANFTTSVPEKAILTKPISETTFSNKVSKVFNLKAEGGKFTPSEIVVKKGDRVSINFQAVDADYDLVRTNPLGAVILAKKGETIAFGFDANMIGTYLYACQKYCGGAKSASWKLIIVGK